MEAKRRLLGISFVGLSVLTVVAAAVWHSGPVRLDAAQGNAQAAQSAEAALRANGPAIAPSPPAVRPDIYAARSAPPTLPAGPVVYAAHQEAANPAAGHQAAAAPSPPPVRTDIRSSRDVVPTREPFPVGHAIATTPARLELQQSLSNGNRLRSVPEEQPYSAEQQYPATGQPTVSQTALLRASDAQPGGPETMLDGNLLLVEAHETAEQADSIVEYTKIVELCQAGIQSGVASEAVRFAHELTAWAYNRRGEAYDALGEANKALVDFNAAVKHEPTRWQAVHNRGVSFAQAGRIREALDDFSRTIQLQPRFAKAYSNRAAISEQHGKLREALIDFQKATELNSTMAPAHAGMGRVLVQLNRHQEALRALDEAIRIDRENPAFLTSRGDAHAAMSNYEAALADYGKAIEVDPTFATAYRNGSWLLSTCPDGRYRDAENAVIGAEKALDLAFGDRHLCLDTLAAAHANAGEFAKAIEFSQQAIQEAPRGVQSFYATRLKMYQDQQPFRTQSAQQAGYVEIVE